MLTIGCSACGRQPTQDYEIRIGMIVSSTGRLNVNAQSTLRGAELAIERQEAAGGLLLDGRPHRITLITEDNEDKSELSVLAARKLVSQNVAAIVGPQTSRHAILAGSVVENARIPLISPISTHPLTTEGKRFVFRMSFTDRLQAQVLARFAGEDLKARRVAVLYDVSNDYNRYMADVFRQAFETDGRRVVAFETYTLDNAEDFSPQLTRIRESRAEVLFLPNVPDDVIKQTRQARQMGIDAVFLGSDAWNPWRLAELPAFDGAFLTHHWHPDIANDQAGDFIAAYRAAYGEQPTSIAALTYDAFGLLFQVIQELETGDPDAIRIGLITTEKYAGVTGSITFRGSGDPIKPVLVLHIKDGQTIPYKVIAP